ncbi:MAG: hypothetical protein ACYC3L_00715 [Gemmatimonadaceae bacterium]
MALHLIPSPAIDPRAAIIPRREAGCLIWTEIVTRWGDTIEVSTTDHDADCVIVEVSEDTRISGGACVSAFLTRAKARALAEALLAAAGAP